MQPINDETTTLKLLSDREAFEQYAAGVPDAALSAEVAGTLADFGAYFKAYPQAPAIDWPTFTAWWKHTRHPTAKPEKATMMAAIIKRVQDAPAPSADMVAALTTGWRRAAFVQRVAEKLIAARQSGFRHDITDDVAALLDTYRTPAKKDAPTAVKSMTLPAMFPEIDANAGDGWDWRMEELNQILGPLRRRNVVLVGARPELGKTSLVADQVSYMLARAPKESVVWVNNEESGDRIFLRHASVVLGARGADIRARREAAYKALMQRTGWTPDTVRVYDAHYATLAQIEAQINALNPSIVVLHRIDKLPAPDKEMSDVQRLEASGFWARRLSESGAHGRAVLAVMQADVSAEGTLFPDDSQLYKSKTGLQSEMDAIIMMGADDKTTNKRGINVPRNKLLGGPRSVDAKKHGRFVCNFDPITGRFRSMVYKDAGAA